MTSYFTEKVLLGDQAGYWRKQVPLLRDYVPLVHLNATRLDVERQFVSFRNPDARALLGQHWPIGVVERVCLRRLQRDSNESNKSKKLYDVIDFRAVHDFLLRTFLHTEG